MKTVVIHHNADYDGIFCREIARKFLPDATLIGWDYGDPTPGKGLLDGTEDLYMLDISVADLMNHPRLIWIDHHKSAMDKYPAPFAGYRIDGVAACRLAWQWFTHDHTDFTVQCFGLPEKQAFIDRRVNEPLAVRLAGEYDIWDKRDPDAELFQHGLRSEPLDEYWPTLLSSGDGYLNGYNVVTRLLQHGKGLQYAKNHENESIIKSAGFTLKFEGLTFLACNHARYNSHLFTAGLTPEHDACLGFSWRKDKWSVSLYHAPGKEHHDLSLIAVKHGGGGHRGACGFTCAALPFNLTDL